VGLFFTTRRVMNRYTTSRDQEERTVQYEKLYKKYEDINIPRITDVKYRIDLYPEKRDLKVDAVLTLKNRGNTSIDSIHFNMIDGFNTQIDLPNSKMTLDDKEHLYRIYQLNTPMQPGDSFPLHIISEYDSKGFENEVRSRKS